MLPGLDKDRLSVSSVRDQALDYQQQGVSTQLISAFVPKTDNAPESTASGGNPCLLLVLENAPGESAHPSPGVTLCQSWPTAYDNKAVIAVNCYTAEGQVIQCCGHGLLAAAYSWLHRLKRTKLTLLMNNNLVISWSEQGMTWLRFERLPTTACPIPPWVANVFPGLPTPHAAAICSSEEGYLVLQWPDEFQLQQLSPPLACLSEYSQRALICTSAHPSVGTDAIQLRYFAPQYGVPEDIATGSAVRVLADYWAPRFTRLTARQCAPVAGALLARSSVAHVEVGGRCNSLKLEDYDL